MYDLRFTSQSEVRDMVSDQTNSGALLRNKVTIKEFDVLDRDDLEYSLYQDYKTINDVIAMHGVSSYGGCGRATR